jgi:hypothetical protein
LLLGYATFLEGASTLLHTDKLVSAWGILHTYHNDGRYNDNDL